MEKRGKNNAAQVGTIVMMELTIMMEKINAMRGRCQCTKRDDNLREATRNNFTSKRKRNTKPHLGSQKYSPGNNTAMTPQHRIPGMQSTNWYQATLNKAAPLLP